MNWNNLWKCAPGRERRSDTSSRRRL